MTYKKRQFGIMDMDGRRRGTTGGHNRGPCHAAIDGGHNAQPHIFGVCFHAQRMP